MEQVRLNHPIEIFRWSENTTQLFGVASAFYKERFGAPGHQAIDYRAEKVAPKNGYGTKILSAHTKNARCISTFVDTTLRTKGNGIQLLEELDDGRKLETLYWHLADIHIRVGEMIEPQQPIGTPSILQKAIGTMGNTGQVFPQPTQNLPWNGVHCHFAVRIYKSDGIPFITDYPGNFVDPVPFLFREGNKLPIKFTRNLFIGMSGDDIAWLQTCLALEGFAKDYQPNSFFGKRTMRDVRLLQQKYAISPSIGYVGIITRQFLMKKYSLYA